MSTKLQFRKELVFLCILSACLYLPSLNAGFIYDDHSQIVANPQIRSWAYFTKLLTTEVWSQKGAGHLGTYYRPFFSIWMLLVHTFGGLKPWFWHLSSIFLHVVVTYLVYRLACIIMTSVAAFWGALFYAVDPIHVDAVSWVSASNELLFTAFILASLVALAKASSCKGQWWIVTSLVFYSAALLSKETALAIFPVFPLFWKLIVSRNGSADIRHRNALRIGALYVMPAGAYLVIRTIILHRTGMEFGRHSWAQVACSSPSLIIFYLAKLVWPSRLAGFYNTSVIVIPTFKTWLAAMGLLFGFGAMIELSRRCWDRLLLGSLVVFPLVPVILGTRVFELGNITHDRYLYLPSAGVCLVISYALYKLTNRMRKQIAFAIIAASISILLCYETVHQQFFYLDDESFYLRALSIDGNNTLVMRYLGDWYLEQNRNHEGIHWLHEAVNSSPDDINAKLYLGRGLMKTRQYEAATLYFKELAYGRQELSRGRRSMVMLSLANAELNLNEVGAADQILKDLKDFNPFFPGLHRTLGVSLQREGKIQEAQKEYSLEFRISGDKECAKQAIHLARGLSGGDITPNNSVGIQDLHGDTFSAD
jgi:protein O-mannosyl-transferase